jgi:hypothetical protein
MLNIVIHRGMAQLVARLAGGQEVTGSSPVTPTTAFLHLTSFIGPNIKTLGANPTHSNSSRTVSLATIDRY